MDLYGALLGLVIILVVLLLNKFRSKPAPPRGPPPAPQIGDITAETLRVYCGYDFMKPILVAVRGAVYDVTDQSALYGPGKPLHIYAGKEVARALALDSLKPEDCGSAELKDLEPEALERLETKLQEMKAQRAELVGQVVPMKELTLEQLAKHNGSDPQLPLFLSIQSTVYDITKGKQFYGPDGMYPFAGRECARALGLLSTEIADCNANIEGLSYTELETLRDWKAKFDCKYPVVGKLVAA